MDTRTHLRLLRRSFLVFVMVTVGIASAQAQGRGGKPGGGGGDTEVETVTITIGTVSGAQLLHDGDPVYEDRRMSNSAAGLGDTCVTSNVNFEINSPGLR